MATGPPSLLRALPLLFASRMVRKKATATLAGRLSASAVVRFKGIKATSALLGVD